MTIIDTIPDVLTPTQAREITDAIKSSIEAVWNLIARAYNGRVWVALNYSSWDDYCSAEFPTTRLRLPREERQEVVSSLRDAGLSTRSIESATGVSRKTIIKDLAEVVESTPPRTATEDDKLADVIGLDGKRYKQPKRKQPKPAPPERIPAQERYADVEAPPDLEQVDEWEYDEATGDDASRVVIGKIWDDVPDFDDVCVMGYQYQSQYGAMVDWFVDVADRYRFTTSDALRRAATVLQEAAEELDRRNGDGRA